MGLAILPALPSEIEKVYDVYFNAFQGDKMGRIMVEILFPGGVNEEFRKAHTAGTLDWVLKTPNQYTYKLFDTDTTEIIGMALGDLYIQERSDEERKFPGVSWLEGEHKERAEAILRPLHEMREELFGGQKYIYVHVISVEPKHQGKKAGAMWCKWGIDLTDGLGLPLYFEASPTTVGLYEKIGYERLDEKIVHKKELMGMEADIEVPLMVRMPSVARGLTFKEWRAAGYPAFGAVKPAAKVDGVSGVSGAEGVEKTNGVVSVDVAEVPV